MNLPISKSRFRFACKHSAIFIIRSVWGRGRLVPTRHTSENVRGRTVPAPSCAVAATVFCSAAAVAALLLTGCVAPIGADSVSTGKAYQQVESNALYSNEPSASTAVILHRYDLKQLAEDRPEEAVRQLYQKALLTNERDLLFALAELSYVTADHIRRSVKPWDPRDARDYYLGSAVYAWLFLFGEAGDPPPGAFDRRFRQACDLYNCSLGLALTGRRSTNAVVQFGSTKRHLPSGEIELQLCETNSSWRLDDFEKILLADQFRVRGLSVRNRQPGIGTPVICVRPTSPEFGARPCSPATILLRGPASLGELESGLGVLHLEVHSSSEAPTVKIAQAEVPLETDLTAYRAYTLTDAHIWKLGRLQFLAPAQRIRNQLLMAQPYEPGRIPVVFVHGTFSSPVTWAEMGNSLIADPVLRRRYQIWSFIYGSGNPLVYSVADLRSALTEQVQRLDPQGTNFALRQMVIIGHSQGGLLTKGTAIDSGDRLWSALTTNRIEDLKVTEDQRAEISRLMYLKPLPFVRRVIFIATPHRGSYLAGSFARRMGQRLVSLPGNLVTRTTYLLQLTEGSESGKFFQGKLPTSLDGMSPKNPALLAMSEVPVAPGIKAHSIIPVQGQGDPKNGRDGLVSYQSAHLDGVESELVVRCKHSCLNFPATIEEVRRILHQHLRQLGAGTQSPSPTLTAPNSPGHQTLVPENQ